MIVNKISRIVRSTTEVIYMYHADYVIYTIITISTA